MSAPSVQYHRRRWVQGVLALLFATSLWWYINNHIIGSRTFEDVAIYVEGLPGDKTLSGLKGEQGNKLARSVTIILSGRKTVLKQLKAEELELIIPLPPHSDSIRVMPSLDYLRCLNPDVNLKADITAITHPYFTIRLTSKSTVNTSIHLLPPSDSPPKGYAFLDIWPNQLIQKLEGPQEMIKEWNHRQLSLTFELNKLKKDQLDLLSERLPLGSELFIPVPTSWCKLDLPPPFPPRLPLNDPQANKLTLILMKRVSLELPDKRSLPIRVVTSASQIKEWSLAPCEEMSQEGGKWVYTGPLFLERVSYEFVQAIAPLLELVVDMDLNRQWVATIEVAHPHEAENRYRDIMKQQHFEWRSDNPDEELDHEQRLSRQFWKFLASLVACDANHDPLRWQVEVNQDTGVVSLERLKRPSAPPAKT